VVDEDTMPKVGYEPALEPTVSPYSDAAQTKALESFMQPFTGTSWPAPTASDPRLGCPVKLAYEMPVLRSVGGAMINRERAPIRQSR
jgi:hypothetical protein